MRTRNTYLAELEQFIREKYKTFTSNQIIPLVKDKFGIDMTPSSIHSYIRNHNIHCGRKGKKMPEKKITTPEIDKFIKENVNGVGTLKMTELVNKEFGTSYTTKQIKGYYNRNKLNSGLTGRFEKGHKSFNKGKTWDEYMSLEGQENSRKTQFKKGNIPHNGGTPVGEIRIRDDHKNRNGKSYYWQKVEQPNVWKMKHIIEWEEHNGKVPEGYMVSFADGDTLNYNIENLFLITKAQNAVRNRHNIKSYDKASAETVKLIANIKMAASKAKKEKRREKNGNTRRKS